MNTDSNLVNSDPGNSVIIRNFVRVSPNTKVTDLIGALCQTQLDNSTRKVGQKSPHWPIKKCSSCALVMENEQLFGIVTVGDIVPLGAKPQSSLHQLVVREIMTEPVVTLPESDFTNCVSAMTLLQQHSIQHLPIVDAEGTVLGLVTDASLRKQSQLLDLLQWREVREVMNQNVTAVSAQSPLSAIAQQLINQNLDFVAVINSDRDLPIPIRIIAKQDFISFLAFEFNLEQSSAEAIMHSPLVSVQPTDSCLRVQELMAEQEVNQLAVTGEQGELIGVVTENSFLEALNPLELYKLADRFQGKLAEQATRYQQTQKELEERRQAEVALQFSERRFRGIFDNMFQLMGLLSPDGILLEANQTALNFAGVKREEVVGRPFWETHWWQISPDTQADLRDAISRAAQGNFIRYEVDVWGINQRAITIDFSLRPVHDEQGEVILLIPEGRDLTETKRLELERQQAFCLLDGIQRRYSSLVEASPVGIFRSDLAGNCIYASEICCEILGLSQEAMKGQGWQQAIHPEDKEQVLAAWSRAIKEKRPFQMEYRFERPDGTVRWVYGQSAAERNSQGQVTGFVGTITDINDRATAEMALKNIIAGTATATGENFFPALVRHVAQALNVSHVLVSALIGEELQTLAFWDNGEYRRNFSYSWRQTPCEPTLQQGEFYCQQFVQQQFPEVRRLAQFGVTSYLGVALYDGEDNIIGNLCIMDREPLPDPEPLTNILHIFAARAAAELERQRTSTLLEELNQDLEAKVEERTTALQSREAQLQDFFDNAHDVIQSVALDTGKFEYVNRAWQQLLGYCSEEVNKLTMFDVLHPDCQQHCQEILTKMRAGQLSNIEHLELGFLSKDGQKVIVEGGITCRWEGNQPIVARAIFRDITERKQAEREKCLLQERLKYLLHSNPAIIYSCSIDYPYQATFISDNVQSILGYQPTDFTQQADFWASRIHPDDAPRVLAELSRFSSEQETHKDKYRFWHGAGYYIWVRDELRLVRDEAGNTLEIVGYLADITEQKQAEEQLQQTNEALIRATRLKDEFLATMSHELRTPLNAILGLTEGLKEQVQGSINEKQSKALNTIEHSGYHLLELINDILDFSKIESGKMELSCADTEIAPLCQSVLAVIKQQSEKKGIQIQTKLPAHLPKVSLDERRIRQVLINLLSNAVKFTPEGGQITLEASLVQKPRPPEATACFHAVRIAVIDTGIGIAPEKVNQLFEPFLQIDSALNRKYQGTGLGLSLVKQIVELHGGEVGVESELGVGSCFNIDLPLQEAPSPLAMTSETEPATESNVSVAKASPRILLAEDNESKIATIFNYLEAKGYHLIVAKNGEEAVQATHAQFPDVILMDLQMSKRDGLATIEEIRCEDRLSQIPIITLADSAMDSDRDRCLQAGANAYLSKPIRMKQLVALIQQLLP